MRIPLLLLLLLPLVLAAGEGGVILQPLPEALKAWDQRLYAQVREQVATHRGPVLRYLDQEAQISAADAEGNLELLMVGSTMSLSWSRLTVAERCAVARDAARMAGTSMHPVLAYFLIADGQGAEAERLLFPLPEAERLAVRAGFAALPVPEPSATASPPVAPRPSSTAAAARRRPLPLQFIVFDAIAVHTEDGQTMGPTGFGHKPTFTRSQRIPPDWRRPVDFVGGSHRITYAVLEKPNVRKVHFCAVLSTPMGAKDKQDLPSHPGSRPFTTATGTAVEEGVFMEGFRKTYQGKAWNWDAIPVRYWEDTYRQGSKQYGPSSVFPIKIRLTLTLMAKGVSYHPYGNVGELDFRTLRSFGAGAELIAQGRLGAALALAERSRGDEPGWVVEALRTHAETRLKELKAYWEEEADCASDELKALALEYAGSGLGERLAGESRAMEQHEATQRARRARIIWNRVLALSNRIEVPDGLGAEPWNAPITMPPELQRKYAKELAGIRSGVEELLQTYSGYHWSRMARNLLHNLGMDPAK